MPVEIRELVIQARVQEDAAGAAPTVVQRTGDTNAPEHITLDQLDPEVVEQIAKVCLERLQDWLESQKLR